MKFSMMEIHYDVDKMFTLWYFQTLNFNGALFEVIFAEREISFDFLYINGIRKYIAYEYEKYKYR